uniref:Electron transfer flavoprotein subunit beta n=1 Tax=Schistosoma curassoni TaxID=6186 RepID=A0A183KAH5_9TREM
MVDVTVTVVVDPSSGQHNLDCRHNLSRSIKRDVIN